MKWRGVTVTATEHITVPVTVTCDRGHIWGTWSAVWSQFALIWHMAVALMVQAALGHTAEWTSRAVADGLTSRCHSRGLVTVTVAFPSLTCHALDAMRTRVAIARTFTFCVIMTLALAVVANFGEKSVGTFLAHIGCRTRLHRGRSFFIITMTKEDPGSFLVTCDFFTRLTRCAVSWGRTCVVGVAMAYLLSTETFSSGWTTLAVCNCGACLFGIDASYNDNRFNPWRFRICKNYKYLVK